MLQSTLFSLHSVKPQFYFVRNFAKKTINKSTMNKSNEMIKHMQTVRSARRKNLGQMAPSNVYFQVLGNGALGGPKSLFLFTNHNRYLFNCGESTQRICTEFTGSKSLAQLCNIFITKKSWDNIGGLAGMCLSVRGTGCPDVTLHGKAFFLVYKSTRYRRFCWISIQLICNNFDRFRPFSSVFCLFLICQFVGRFTLFGLFCRVG